MTTLQDNNELYSNMRQMISLIDRLRDFHLHEYVSLPRIAVLGEQSAGKSSLLESICGLNFLPRGSGIVTRRPLELRMIKSNIDQSYFMFPQDFPEQKFYDPKKVTETIEMLTERVAGSSKGISDVPIVCQIYSATVPDLTMIDLPGITRNAVEGQPQNIEKLTKDLVKQYCENKDTLILCVIPANIDLSNSDALKLSRKLDESGERTIGVLTKVDLMDQGTDCLKTLNNQEIPLLHGYIGIKGRSQANVISNMSVQEAIEQENDFFTKNPIYSTLPQSILGTRSLITKISSLLYQMIKKSLPWIKKEILEKKKRVKENLHKIGEAFPDTQDKKLELVFKLIREFKDNFNQGIAGKYYHSKLNRTNVKEKSEETTISKINEHFSELYHEYMDKDFAVTKEYTDSKVSQAINTYQNVSIPGFHSFDSFLYLINPQLEKLKEPVMNLLEECKNVIEEDGSEIIDFIFRKFPNLHHEIKDSFQKELQLKKNDVKFILENLIKCEDGYLFTNDPVFIKSKEVTEQKGEVVDLLILEMRSKIDAYFNIVVRNLRDQVPKIIGQFLLKAFNSQIEMKIIQHLSKKNYCLETIEENQAMATKREMLTKELDSLVKAESLLFGGIESDKHIGFDKILQTKNAFGQNKDKQVKKLAQLENIHDSFLDFNTNILQAQQMRQYQSIVQPQDKVVINVEKQQGFQQQQQDWSSSNQRQQAEQQQEHQRIEQQKQEQQRIEQQKNQEQSSWQMISQKTAQQNTTSSTNIPQQQQHYQQTHEQWQPSLQNPYDQQQHKQQTTQNYQQTSQQNSQQTQAEPSNLQKNFFGSSGSQTQQQKERQSNINWDKINLSITPPQRNQQQSTTGIYSGNDYSGQQENLLNKKDPNKNRQQEKDFNSLFK